MFNYYNYYFMKNAALSILDTESLLIIIDAISFISILDLVHFIVFVFFSYMLLNSSLFNSSIIKNSEKKKLKIQIWKSFLREKKKISNNISLCSVRVNFQMVFLFDLLNEHTRIYKEKVRLN